MSQLDKKDYFDGIFNSFFSFDYAGSLTRSRAFEELSYFSVYMTIAKLPLNFKLNNLQIYDREPFHLLEISLSFRPKNQAMLL